MQKKIFYSILSASLFILAIFSILLTITTYSHLFENEKQKLKITYFQMKHLIESDPSSIENLILNYRITIVGEDGTVLYDNRKDFSLMENHSNREEIIALRFKKNSESTRFSDTLGEQTYYYAEKLADGRILRVSLTMDSVYSIFLDIIPYILIFFFLIVFLTIFISKYLAKKIILPISNIDEPIYDELDVFYGKIKGQKNYIEKQENKLAVLNTEFEIISKNIGDGFIILGKNNEIVSINQKASRIFGNTSENYINKDILILNHSFDFSEVLNKAYKGDNCEIGLDINGKIYIFLLNPIITNENTVAGIVIIIIDNTEKAKVERLRKEFSANVSHELKTPLTSILGYAELINTGIAKREDIPSFCTKIYTEAKNLLSLIEDIIKISNLDESNILTEKENFNIELMIIDILNRLDFSLKNKNISLEYSPANIHFNGIKILIEEMLYNIIENAIKYNNIDGTIKIAIMEDERNIIIKIKDTGLGINAEYIDRIFERFYRIDKSHSSIVKGTGLGLAIVKHIVVLHKGKISVISKENLGSEFIVELPKY